LEHHLTLTLVSIALLGIGAQWLAWRIKMPAIVLLTVAGLVAGPVTGWLQPSRDLEQLFDPLIKLGVAVILFEGGLTLRFHEFRQAAHGVMRLVTVGVIVSFGLGSAAAHYVGGLNWPVALVFGAIIVVTGPTVIIPLLRQARLRRRPASFLKWEGIVNDPTGALLAVVLFEYFRLGTHADVERLATEVGLGLTVAAALGVGAGYTLGQLFRRGFVPEYLKGPGALVAALGVYVGGNWVLTEGGLLAATLLGLTLGNMRLPSIDEIRRFKEYIALMLVSAVFVMLAADFDPELLLALDWRAAALLAAIIFVVRPVSIWLSTAWAGMSWQERALLAWIAPRGIVAAAVAGVFGPALVAAGYAGGELLLPLIFSLILLTVVLHGFSISWLAKRLGLSAEGQHGVLIVGASLWSIGLAQALKDKGVPVMIVDNSWHRLRPVRLAGLPTFYGNILSEASEQRLEFNDYGCLLAATDSDAFNAMVCTYFASEMGRHRVFQLPDASSEEPDPKRLPRTRRGMIVPAEKAWFEDLLSNWYRGWTFQKTLLSEEFDFEQYSTSLPEGGLPIVVVRENAAVEFFSPERALKPKAGDTVIWYGPKSAASANEMARRRDADQVEAGGTS